MRARPPPPPPPTHPPTHPHTPTPTPTPRRALAPVSSPPRTLRCQLGSPPHRRCRRTCPHHKRCSWPAWGTVAGGRTPVGGGSSRWHGQRRGRPFLPLPLPSHIRSPAKLVHLPSLTATQLWVPLSLKPGAQSVQAHRSAAVGSKRPVLSTQLATALQSWGRGRRGGSTEGRQGWAERRGGLGPPIQECSPRRCSPRSPLLHSPPFTRRKRRRQKEAAAGKDAAVGDGEASPCTRRDTLRPLRTQTPCL